MVACDGNELPEIYAAMCAESHCKANSALRRQFADRPGDRTVDLSLNFVGPGGCGAVVATVQRAPCVDTFSLRDNQVGNDVVD
jgi:hypothetical protein